MDDELIDLLIVLAVGKGTKIKRCRSKRKQYPRFLPFQTRFHLLMTPCLMSINKKLNNTQFVSHNK